MTHRWKDRNKSQKTAWGLRSFLHAAVNCLRIGSRTAGSKPGDTRRRATFRGVHPSFAQRSFVRSAPDALMPKPSISRPTLGLRTPSSVSTIPHCTDGMVVSAAAPARSGNDQRGRLFGLSPAMAWAANSLSRGSLSEDRQIYPGCNASHEGDTRKSRAPPRLVFTRLQTAGHKRARPCVPSFRAR
jgi:hypothetical protein